MRLSIVVNSVFYRHNGKYYTDASFLNFATSFLNSFDEIIFCVPVTEVTEMRGKYKVDFDRIKVVELPPLGSNVRYFLHLSYHIKEAYKTIEKNLRFWDLVWVIEGPQFTPYISMVLCFIKKKPYFFYIRMNLLKQIARRRYSSVKNVIAKLFAILFVLLSRIFMSISLTFCLGKELYTELYGRKNRGNVHHVISTSIQKGDIFRGEKEFGQECSLLYVGRLDSIKGVEYLIEGLQKLKEKTDLPVKLKIVGTGDDERNLRKMVTNSSLNDDVAFLGYIPFGSDLIEIYRKCDIFVLPSFGEGTPKVLPEALSQGLPVIATTVGGIPDMIENGKNGLLIPPGDSDAIYRATVRLYSNKGLLKQMSENNLRDAWKFTIEVQRKKMLDIVSARFPRLRGL